MVRCPKCPRWLTAREAPVHRAYGCKAKEAARGP